MEIGLQRLLFAFGKIETIWPREIFFILNFMILVCREWSSKLAYKTNEYRHKMTVHEGSLGV